jgi:glucosylceramidase
MPFHAARTVCQKVRLFQRQIGGRRARWLYNGARQTEKRPSSGRAVCFEPRAGAKWKEPEEGCESQDDAQETFLMSRHTAGQRVGRRALIKSAIGMAALSAVRPLRGQTQAPGAGRGSVVTGGTTSWIATTESAAWQEKPLAGARGFQWDTLDLRVRLDRPGQVVDGFGACFNELGYTSIEALEEADREAVLRQLFAPGAGANFTICRMPVGANDFARDWYSYDETPDDFELRHFSIANDLETLVPFIRAAKRYQPRLRLWASPWSPPTWMKTNGHYAATPSRPGAPSNGLRPDQVGREGTDMFRLDDRYLRTYAQYFGKFIDAYRAAGIEIAMVMPQNEFNSAQPFPSCTWTAEGLARFIRLLGPEMARRGVEVYFGTLERANIDLLRTSMNDSQAGRYIVGGGVQWAGKNAIAEIHREFPKLRLYQSEQECGDGRNDWRYCGYTWQLMKHYFRSGVNAYMYWNISLETGGSSRWGWQQNSLVTVDKAAKTYRWNHEYHVLKHLSHFVEPGASVIETEGTLDDALAFRNRDGSVVIVLRNARPYAQPVTISTGGPAVTLTLDADSYNTVVLA